MLSRAIVETGVLALVLATAAALFALFEVPPDTSDLIFGTIMLWCAVGVFRLVWNARSRARAERHSADQLEATSLAQAAQEAVVEERVRIAADVEAVVRASVTTMGSSADEAERLWEVDPTTSLLAVQDEGSRATSELRRMLGLLREADQLPADRPESDRFAYDRSVREVPPGVMLLCLASVTLAIFERYPQPADVPTAFYSAGAVVLNALAAATVILCRRAPALGATACGGFFVLGSLIGAPVSPGSWILLTPAVLAWSAAATGTRSGILALVALLGGVTLDLGWYLPVNLPICLVIIGTAALGGAAVGRSNRRKAAAHDRVVRRSTELSTVTSAAVSAERLAVARDLHDVVSHAVAVMVMQAGAAKALRWIDPGRAQAALAVVRRTASETLGELDGLVEAISAGALGIPSNVPGAVVRDSGDLAALVDRMEGAGLRITLRLNGRLTGSMGTAVYRITQRR